MSGQASGAAKDEVLVPHDHDVLSGRGNFVNYHAGNEHFRALVRKHKVAYVACPKPQKGKFSRMIVDEIRQRNPPGRFLKQDNNTKLWHDIGDKKALDKTRQALREGAPDLLKDLENSDEEDEDDLTQNNYMQQQEYRRQPQSQFGLDDNPYNNMGGLQTTILPPSVVSSAMGLPGLSSVSYQHPIIQNRGIPGMFNTQPGLDAGILPPVTRIQALSGGDVEHVQKLLHSMYPIDNFEPTPINPNLQIKVRDFESYKTHIAPVGRGIERSDSLTFDNVFAKEQGSSGKVGRLGNSANHLSAMSCSMGDMSEANLSAVFEDSLRISDVPVKVQSKSDIARKRSMSPHGSSSTAGVNRPGNFNMSTQMDMSMQTINHDELNVTSASFESSMLNMSFKSKD